MLKKTFPFNNFKEVAFYLFLISLFLFLIPNFYAFIIIKNSFLTTQAIARILISVSFLLNILITFIDENYSFFSFTKSKLIVKVVLIFFIIQSLSVIFAINIEAFLLRYKDILISLIFLILAQYYKSYLSKIIYTLLLGSFINILYQLILVFNSDLFINLFSNLIYQKHFNFVLANLERGRIYVDFYNEIIIPFIFLKLKRKSFNKIFYTIFIFLIISLSFLSNFRTRILMVLFSVVLSLFFLIKSSLRNKFLFIISLFILLYSVFNYSYFFNPRLYIRANNIEEILNKKTLLSRINQIKNSIDMGSISLFGVGLGNYFDNISAMEKNNGLITSKSVKFVKLGAEEYVHNIFGLVLSESGYFGLIIFFYLIFLFAKSDSITFKKNNKYSKALVLSFWTLFIYGFFNPIVPGSYQILFWGTRGLLI